MCKTSSKLCLMYVIMFLFRERTLGKGTFGKVKLAYHTVVEEYV